MTTTTNAHSERGYLFAHPRREIGAAIQIVLLGVGAAVTYGILQDQVTAHVCVEYFTIGHIDFFNLGNPTLIAFEWGLIATWWAGLLLGVPIALIARVGKRRPRLSARDLLRPTLLLQGCVGLVALVSGITGYVAAKVGAVYLTQPLAAAVPQAKHAAFLADLWAHDAAYAAGALGGVTLGLWAWRRRGVLQRTQRDRGHQDNALVSPTRRATIHADSVLDHDRQWWEIVILRVLLIIGGLSLGLGVVFVLVISALSGL